VEISIASVNEALAMISPAIRAQYPTLTDGIDDHIHASEVKGQSFLFDNVVELGGDLVSLYNDYQVAGKISKNEAAIHFCISAVNKQLGLVDTLVGHCEAELDQLVMRLGRLDDQRCREEDRIFDDAKAAIDDVMQ